MLIFGKIVLVRLLSKQNSEPSPYLRPRHCLNRQCPQPTVDCFFFPLLEISIHTPLICGHIIPDCTRRNA